MSVKTFALTVLLLLSIAAAACAPVTPADSDGNVAPTQVHDGYQTPTEDMMGAMPMDDMLATTPTADAMMDATPTDDMMGAMPTAKI